MIKFCTLLSLAAFASGYRIAESDRRSFQPHQQDWDIVENVKSHGYPCENHTVETSDGYVLDLIRIPNGVRQSEYSNNNEWNDGQSKQGPKDKRTNWQSQKDENSESDDSDDQDENQPDVRPAILLMHGLLGSANDFVVGGPTEGLAYILADKGYDVFLGNVRGNIYGRKHTVLNPERDAAFWRFSLHEIGVKDLPAIIDKILKITNQKQINYIGHTQGSTVFYVMASEKLEYNTKIRAMISLGPVAFLGHSTNSMLKLVAEKEDSKGWITRHLGPNEFKPTRECISEGGESVCFSHGNNEKVCKNPFFLLNGYNSRNLNMTSIVSIINSVPSGSSTNQIIHYAQLVKSGTSNLFITLARRFQKFSANSEDQAEDYRLEKVTTPIGVIYTPHDTISSVVEVEKLCQMLPNVKQSKRIDELTNNVDLLYGKRVADIVYVKLLKMLKMLGNDAANTY